MPNYDMGRIRGQVKSVVPRQTNAFKVFIRGCEVTIRQFESAVEAAIHQGFVDRSARHGLSDLSDGGNWQGNIGTRMKSRAGLVYRGL